jgi:hypothetical protein
MGPVGAIKVNVPRAAKARLGNPLAVSSSDFDLGE